MRSRHLLNPGPSPGGLRGRSDALDRHGPQLQTMPVPHAKGEPTQTIWLPWVPPHTPDRVETIAVLADRSLSTLLEETSRSEDFGVHLYPRARPRAVVHMLASELVDELVESYLTGASAGQLALQFKVSKATVLNHLERREVPKRVYRKVHGDLLDAAQELYESGGSLRSVAAEVGVTRGALRAALVLAGVVIRDR